MPERGHADVHCRHYRVGEDDEMLQKMMMCMLYVVDDEMTLCMGLPVQQKL